MPKTLENEWIGYLIDNISLANDVSVFVDAIKVRIIQDVMKININQVSSYKIRRPPTEESGGENLSTTYTILKETSQNWL